MLFDCSSSAGGHGAVTMQEPRSSSRSFPPDLRVPPTSLKARGPASCRHPTALLPSAPKGPATYLLVCLWCWMTMFFSWIVSNRAVARDFRSEMDCGVAGRLHPWSSESRSWTRRDSKFTSSLSPSGTQECKPGSAHPGSWRVPSFSMLLCCTKESTSRVRSTTK